MPTDSAAMLPSLLASMPTPDPALFAAIDDAPTAPGDVAAGAAWAHVATLQLELAAQAAAALGPTELGLEALVAQEQQGWSSGGGSAPRGGGDAPPPSGVLIEEMEVEEEGAGSAVPQPLPSELPVLAVLAAALYGGDAHLQRPWAEEAAAAAAAQLLSAVAEQLPSALAVPHRTGTSEPPLLEAASTARSAGEPSAAGAGQREQLVALAAPAALRRLQPALLARVEHDRHKSARLQPYAGEPAVVRCVEE